MAMDLVRAVSRRLNSASAGSRTRPDALALNARLLSSASTKESPAATSPRKPAPPARVLSGIQPTGAPHLGNYFGALKNWVAMQSDPLFNGAPEHTISPGFETAASSATRRPLLYSIVDLHALTVPQSPAALRKSVLVTAAALLACGIDPRKSVLFRQSRVPQHSELMWLLACVTPSGELQRMHQWKTKVAYQLGKSPSDAFQEVFERTMRGGDPVPGLHLGLFAYPVLMSADILLYRATHVPVGEDQLQHLSLAIDLVKAFNSATKSDILVEPAPILAPVKKIMSLKDGKLKMSKSDPAEHSRISLDDDEKTIRLRLKRSKTDNMGDVTLDAVNRPEVANLLAIYGECAGVSLEQAAERFRGVSLGDFKKELEDAVVKTIEPISREMMRLLACPEHLVAILESGEEAAREEASKVLSMVQRSLGLR